MATKRKRAGAPKSWRETVAWSLDWEEGHASLEHAVDGLAASLRGKRPAGSPHSVWELLDHIRRTQADLLEFLTNADYVALEWPREYWPPAEQVPTPRQWSESLGAIKRDRQALQRLATRGPRDLTKPVPWGEGQTYLRTILLAADHTAYHVGQIVLVRKLLGAWKG
jgi:hypothetical protein